MLKPITSALVNPYYAYHVTAQGLLVAVTFNNDRHEKLTVVFGGYERPDEVVSGPVHRVRYVSGVVGAIQTLSKVLAEEFKSLDDLKKSFALAERLFQGWAETPQPVSKCLDFELTKLQLLSVLEFGAPGRDLGPAVRYWWTQDDEFKERELGDLITYAAKFGAEICSDAKEVWLVDGRWKIDTTGAVTKHKKPLEALVDESDLVDETHTLH